MATQPTLPSPTHTNALSPSPHGTPAPLTIGNLPTMQQLPTVRDPEWLKLEVCREFQRGACSRSAEDCKYAHPGKNLQIMPDGKVTACFDALKGRCSRDSCKYLHPPPHLKQQLEINGRNNLIQQRAMLVTPQTIMQLPSGPVQVNSTQPILSGIPQVATANHMYTQAQVATSPGYTLIPAGDFALNSLNSPLFYYANNVPSTNAHPMALATNAQVATIASPMNNISRADKLEVCRDFQRGNCTRGENECRYAHPFDRTMIDPTDNKVTVCMDCIKGRCIRDKCKYFHPPVHLQAKVRACQHQVAAYMPTVQANTHTLTTTQPGMVGQTLKRPLAVDADLANNSMTNALGQPPQKRHAVEPKVMSGSPSIGASITPSPTGTPTLYSYGIPMHQHAATPAHAHAYYQAPFFSIYNGASAAGMQSAQSALTTLPTANGQANVSNATALAILNGQSQTTSSLTVCRDYQSGKCSRPYCRFVHVTEDYVEVKDDRVTICKDALFGKCARNQCRFYHYPPQEREMTPQQGYQSLPSYTPTESYTPSSAINPVAQPPMMYPQMTQYVTTENQVQV